MYCLGFRGAGQTGEEKSDHTSGGAPSDKMGNPFGEKERESSQYKITDKLSAIKLYQSPSNQLKGVDRALAKYRESKYNNDSQERKTDSPTSEDLERESRFQRELQQAHRDLKKKTRPSNRNANTSSAFEFDGNVVTDRESMAIDLTLLETRETTNESASQLRKENRKLKRELRRTYKFLECERAQKNALQGRVENLEKQIETLRDAQLDLDDNKRNQHSLVSGLQRQVAQYQKQLQEEQMKTKRLQREMEASKTENEKCKEKMGVMMFQHVPTSSPEFEDIGPCNPNIVESTDLVADYELGAKLGEGHYGKVAVGTDLATKKKYAIKVLNKGKIIRFKDLQQVTMEVHVLRKYPHPNIVHLHEVIHAPENLYLVTELCSMDLHKYHNDVGLTEHGAQQVIFGVLKPLHFLHSNGICHLDLKPENILLTADVDLKNITHNDIRLCDFGLVNMAKNPVVNKEIVRKGYACGTPGFFAPEMILKNAFEGRQADMWSLGCIILEITLGFTQEWIDSYDQTESNPAAFRQGLENCLEEIAPQHYPRHTKLMGIIHGCLSIEPSKRISSYDALSHPWLNEIVKSDEGREDAVGNPSFQIDQERSGFLPTKIFC